MKHKMLFVDTEMLIDHQPAIVATKYIFVHETYKVNISGSILQLTNLVTHQRKSTFQCICDFNFTIRSQQLNATSTETKQTRSLA